MGQVGLDEQGDGDIRTDTRALGVAPAVPALVRYTSTAAMVVASVVVVIAGAAGQQTESGAKQKQADLRGMEGGEGNPAGADLGGMETGEADQDETVRRQVTEILSRPEFTEFVDTDTRGFRQVMERLGDYLSRMFDFGCEQEESNRQLDVKPFSIPLPSARVLTAVLAAVLLIAVVYLLVSNRPRFDRAADREAAEKAGAVVDPREQAPSVFLDRAARLAEEGKLREALREVYLATLIALDRRQLINFEPSRTNHQYLRQIPPGETRTLFATLTRIFDRKWYGHQQVTLAEYRDCSATAENICMPRTQAAPDREQA